MTPGLPNFFLLGAPRSGTTALYYTLRQHPDVFMAAHKEPLHMAIRDRNRPFAGPGDGQGVADEPHYRDLFADAGHAKVVGEASTMYLASPVAAANIGRMVPDARLVAVLRDPAERAFSHYKYHRREGRETLSTFREALLAEEARLAKDWSPHWGYARAGYYDQHLQEYAKRFAPEQLHVVTYDKLVNAFEQTVADMYRFLGVDPAAVSITNARYNPSGQERIRPVGRWLRRSRPLGGALEHVVPRGVRRRIDAWRQRAYAKTIKAADTGMDPAVRRQLVEAYTADIDRLEQRLGQDLSAWRKVDG